MSEFLSGILYAAIGGYMALHNRVGAKRLIFWFVTWPLLMWDSPKDAEVKE
jgi:hypothetical protein